MPPPSESDLIQAAMAARRHAVAPYSKFKVGAAVVTQSGRMFTGVNVENASFGLTCCAERVAVFKALSDGERRIVTVAVVARTAGGPMPCGACRQVLSEFAPRAKVLVADSKAASRIRRFTVAELLPEAFSPSAVK